MNDSNGCLVTATADADNRKPLAAIGGVSAAALVFLVWLIYFRDSADATGSYAYLPAVNASLNALAAVCLAVGIMAIRNGATVLHQRLMTSAFVFSTLFLISYIVYHANHGDTRFTGEGFIRPVYFFVLISHIVLSAIALPMVLTTFYFSLSGQFGRHRRIARYTFPLWMYVSVTGVLIFLMLKLAG